MPVPTLARSPGPIVMDQILPPKEYLGVELRNGQTLRIVDVEGKQVPDLVAFNLHDPRERMSTNNSRLVQKKWLLTTGDALYSDEGNVLLRITDDTVGIHDLTLTPCSQQTFDVLYPELGGAPHPSCFANLVEALGPHGVDPDRIGVTLNVFMDVWTDEDGELHIDPPPTRPGDRFTVEARVPLVAGITACSAEKSNNGRCTPVDYRVDRA